MPARSLHAVQLPASTRLVEHIANALDGSGPAIAPIPLDLPASRLRSTIAALRPSALVTPEGATALRDGEPVAEDTAVVVSTSGSTGGPKAAELSARALTASARASLARLGAGSGERWLLCLPPHHIAGIQVIVRSLVSGTDPVLHQRFDPNSAADSGVSHVAVVPTMLHRMLGAGRDLSAFRTILLGGAAATPELLERARIAGAHVVTTYGMTETCGGCVYDGVPLDGVQVDVTGDRIRIAGSTLFSGYRLRPDLTRSVFDAEWFVTDDIGRFIADRLCILGKTADVINTGGEKVIPADVAALVAGHPAVEDVIVVGRPDRDWGERVVAVVVPHDVTRPPTLDEIRAHVRERAPAHLAPRELDVVDRIPVLPSGKPDREALRRR